MSKSQGSKNNILKKSSLCKVCGAVLPEDSQVCLICGTHRGGKKEQIEIVDTQVYTPVSPRILHRTRRITRMVAFVLFLVFVVSSAGALFGEYLGFQSLLSLYNTKNSLIYQQQNNLKIKLTGVEKPALITDKYNNDSGTLLAKDSSNNRFVAYIDNQTVFADGYKGSLYLLDLTKIGSDTEKNYHSMLVTSGEVVDFAFSPDEDSLIFLTVNGSLYKVDFNNPAQFLNDKALSKTLLDQDVKGISQVSGDKVLYYKGRNATTNTLKNNNQNGKGISVELFLLSTNQKDLTPVKIDSAVYSILDSNKDISQIMYTRVTQVSPFPKFSVGLFDTQENLGNIVAHSIDYIVEASISGENMVYLTSSEESLQYDQLFEDSLLSSDILMKNPAQFEEAELESLSELELQKEEEDWQDKDYRDMLRYKLRQSLRSFKGKNVVAYQLNVLNLEDKSLTVVANDIYSINDTDSLISSNLSKGYLLFVSGNIEQLVAEDIAIWGEEDVQKILSQGTYDIRGHIAERLPENLVLYDISKKNSGIVYTEVGDKVIDSFFIEPDANEVFFISRPSYLSATGTLYSTSIKSDKVDKVTYIDDNAIAYLGIGGKDNDNVYYQTASKSIPPELVVYKLSPEGVEEISVGSSDASTIKLMKNPESLVFFRDYIGASKSGDLWIYTEGNASFIANQAHQYMYITNAEMVVVQNSESREKSISHWRGNQLTEIISNVDSYSTFNLEMAP